MNHCISPVCFSIFGIDIYWYGIIYVVGVILASIYCKYFIKSTKCPIATNHIDTFFPVACFAIIIGSRLGHIIFYDFLYYAKNPIEILNLRNGGLSFHGGLIGLFVATWFFCKKEKLNLLIFADILASAAPIGLFLGRIANFINGELYGKPTDSFIGFYFKDVLQKRHPSQLYESFLEGVALFFILFKMRNIWQKEPGKIASMFVILYSVFRFFVEFFKDSEIVFYMTTGQWLSILMFTVGICFLRFVDKKTVKETIKEII